jgi:hypothetical protein
MYTLDFNRILSDPAMQTIIGGSLPIFEGERGERISTSVFSILNQAEMMICEVGNVRSAVVLLDEEDELVFSPAVLV